MSSLVMQRRRRWPLRAASRGALAWLASLLIHAGGTIGLGYISTPAAPDSASGTSRSIELTLINDEGLSDKEAVRRVVFAAAQSAPALLEQAPVSSMPIEPGREATPIDDPNVVPAAYSPPASLQPTATELFGIRAYGRRFVYVFDRSASMEGRALEAAKRQLALSLGDLTPRDFFQVIFYNDRPLLAPARRGSPSGLLAGDEPSKRLVLQFIGGIFAEGPTNQLTALATALELRPDVVYFLTDASGETLRPDQLDYIRRVNRTAIIHTVEFGSGPQLNHPSFLTILALENGGQHAYIDLALIR